MQFTTITEQQNVSQDSRPLLVSVIVTRQTLGIRNNRGNVSPFVGLPMGGRRRPQEFQDINVKTISELCIT